MLDIGGEGAGGQKRVFGREDRVATGLEVRASLTIWGLRGVHRSQRGPSQGDRQGVLCVRCCFSTETPHQQDTALIGKEAAWGLGHRCSGGGTAQTASAYLLYILTPQHVGESTALG